MKPTVVIMGDLVASSSLPELERQVLQHTFMQWLDELQLKLGGAAGTKASITAGDAFQLVVTDSEAVAEALWHLWSAPEGFSLRVGVGRGRVFTDHYEDPRLMDGPAFHLARRAVSGEESKITFSGFSPTGDAVLTGLSSLMDAHIMGLTRKQRRVLELLHEGVTHKQAASALGVTRQYVTRSASVARWDALRKADSAMREALRFFSETPIEGDGDQ